jgi:hypothetical protein
MYTVVAGGDWSFKFYGGRSVGFAPTSFLYLAGHTLKTIQTLGKGDNGWCEMCCVNTAPIRIYYSLS